MNELPRDLVAILRTEARRQRTPPIDYVIAGDGGRMVHKPEPDIAMAELLEEAAAALAALAAKVAEMGAENARLREAAIRVLNWAAQLAGDNSSPDDAREEIESVKQLQEALSAIEATPPAPMVTEDRPTHCGGCGETEPAKRCIGCLADFGPASLHQQETADEIADETVETAADAMAGAAVHAIREMLNEIGVPQAAFIDDHVRNGLVWARRKALEEAAQVADDEAEIERPLKRREAAQSADYIAQRIRELKER